ncbi:MAG: hypothetical protein WAW96_08390, partial [Alphaproteobacteria bacterium]
RIDLAYGCFAWIALVLCASLLLSFVPMDPSTSEGFGMLIGMPVALAMLAAGLVAVVLSIIEWRTWPLVTMSAVVVSMLLMLIAEVEWKLVSEDVSRAWYIGSTALLVFLCARWFAFARKRGN